MTAPPDAGSWVAPKVPPGPAPGLAYGGFWIRTLAYLIDTIVLVGALLGVSYATGIEFLDVTTRVMRSGEFQSISVFGSPTPIAWLVLFGYFAGSWALFGRTLGMAPFRLRILRSTDGSRLGPGRAILRFFGLILSFFVFLVGVIWVAADSRKQGWHDKIAGTVVVRPTPGSETQAPIPAETINMAQVDG